MSKGFWPLVYGISAQNVQRNMESQYNIPWRNLEFGKPLREFFAFWLPSLWWQAKIAKAKASVLNLLTGSNLSLRSVFWGEWFTNENIPEYISLDQVRLVSLRHHLKIVMWCQNLWRMTTFLGCTAQGWYVSWNASVPCNTGNKTAQVSFN